jgi:hypothetical protein
MIVGSILAICLTTLFYAVKVLITLSMYTTALIAWVVKDISTKCFSVTSGLSISKVIVCKLSAHPHNRTIYLLV